MILDGMALEAHELQGERLSKYFHYGMAFQRGHDSDGHKIQLDITMTVRSQTFLILMLH